MDKSRISKIIIAGESEISTLDQALHDHNTNTADWTLSILCGIFQDLERLAGEEPIPTKIDKLKLSETVDIALALLSEVRIGIDKCDYCYASAELSLLRFVLDDIPDLIKGEKSEIGSHQNNTHVADS